MCFLLTATDYSIAGIKRCEFYREGKGDHKLYTRYVEGRKRVKLVGYDLPDPRIVVIEATKPEGSIGNPFIIRIVGANLGAYSPEGTITVSFPGDPVMLMECSANIKGQCQYYPKGSILANAYGRQTVSQHPMVELTITDWNKDDRHWMELMITPFQKGTFRLAIRATARNRFSMGYVNYPYNSWKIDQQSWPVQEYFFQVR